jgi:hypothetical protein
MSNPNYYNKKKHKQSNLYMSTIYTVYYSLFQKATVPFLTAYENINKIYFSDDITLSSFTSVVSKMTFTNKAVEFYFILTLGSIEKMERI